MFCKFEKVFAGIWKTSFQTYHNLHNHSKDSGPRKTSGLKDVLFKSTVGWWQQSTEGWLSTQCLLWFILSFIQKISWHNLYSDRNSFQRCTIFLGSVGCSLHMNLPLCFLSLLCPFWKYYIHCKTGLLLKDYLGNSRTRLRPSSAKPCSHPNLCFVFRKKSLKIMQYTIFVFFMQ